MLAFYGFLIMLSLFRKISPRIIRPLSFLLLFMEHFEVVVLAPIILVLVVVMVVLLLLVAARLIVAGLLVEAEGVFYIAPIVGVIITQLVVAMTYMANLGRAHIILPCYALTILLDPIRTFPLPIHPQ